MIGDFNSDFIQAITFEDGIFEDDERDKVDNYATGKFQSIFETSPINSHYPFSDEFDYETGIETIDFDKEMDKDLRIGKGFLVSPFQSIKKDLKDPDGIFSYRFGQSLSDVNQYMDRYKCRCGALKHRINHGLKCPICGTRCEFVDDDFEYFGWMRIEEPYAIIHPAYYKKLESMFGKGISINGIKRTKLENIIEVDDKKDIDGHSTEQASNVKNEPFFGIGMIDFQVRFDEIMAYYIKTRPNKKEMYDDIMANREKVFTHHIPVFSTLMRATDIKDSVMSYEPTNAMYMMMNKLRTSINKNRTRIDKNKKVKNQKLYKLQIKYIELYDELAAGLSGKKGDFRCLMGGRYNLSSRNVIVQNPDLRIDQVTLPYVALVIMLEQRIKNILHRMYNISFAEAHQIWYKAIIEPDEQIKGIINSIIQNYRKKGLPGIPVIINRNPTIGYGSILQMFCVGFTMTYTMAVPLQPLPLLGADFDGDVLNILLIINETFFRVAYEIFNPRNAFYISRNDGYYNMSVSMQRDTLINANTLVGLGRNGYSPEELNALRQVTAQNQQLYY